MHLIDTHAHLDFPDFDPDRPEVLKRAQEQGVREIISIGTDLDSSRRAVELAKNFVEVWATVGIHPCNVMEAPENYLETLRELASTSRVVALGEIGLDYHHLPSREVASSIDDNTYKQRQGEIFKEQLALAVELGLNVVIHQRDAWNDTLTILKNYTGKLQGVFHCFGGSILEAEEVIKLGHLVSFTGIVTFKNAQQVTETATKVPENKWMVETDCPYLAPAPYRGKRCEPSYTRFVAEHIAKLRKISLETVAEQTTQTARNFFKFNR